MVWWLCKVSRPHSRKSLLRRGLILPMYPHPVVQCKSLGSPLVLKTSVTSRCPQRWISMPVIKAEKTSPWAPLSIFSLLMIPCLVWFIFGVFCFGFLFCFSSIYSVCLLTIIHNLSYLSNVSCVNVSCSNGHGRQEIREWLCVLFLLGEIDVNMTLVDAASLWKSTCDKDGEELPSKAMVWWAILCWMTHLVVYHLCALESFISLSKWWWADKGTSLLVWL